MSIETTFMCVYIYTPSSISPIHSSFFFHFLIISYTLLHNLFYTHIHIFSPSLFTTMMPKTWDYSVAALLFLPSLLLQCAAAAGNVHVVGDTTGWIIPPNTNFYVTWASSKTFQLNDILTFNFATNQHDVVRVLKQSYDSCSTNNQIGTTIFTGPANVTLNETGAHYFICSFGNHCQLGQKLAITVGSSTTPAGSPSPSSSPTGTPQPPPPPSSAAPSALAGSFLIIMLSFALGKLVL